MNVYDYTVNGEAIEKDYDTLNRKIKELSAMINRYKEEYVETLSNDDTFVVSMTSVKYKYPNHIYIQSEKMDEHLIMFSLKRWQRRNYGN